MNIGLQPQYPTIWWVDGVLAGIVVLGLLSQIVVSAIHRRKLEQNLKEVEKARIAWEGRVSEQKKEIALSRGVKEAEVSLWDTDEPRFEVNRLDPEVPPIGPVISIGALIVLFCTALATVIMCVPFNSKYYNYYVEKGTVGEVTSTITVGDDSVGAFTFKLDGNPKPYTMYDPRIKTLEGQEVSLLCHAGWNNQAADTWTCDLRDYAGSTR